MKTHSITMQTMMTKTKFVLIAFLVAFSFSCSPEDGNDGATGSQGEQGPSGQDGNANVIESNWLQIQFDETNATNDYGQMIIKNNDIENFINTGGILLMYIKIEEAEEFIIYPLPVGEEFTFVVANVPSESLENALVFDIRTTEVSIYENTPFYTIKYVIIPPAVATASKNIDYSKMTYQEVMSHFSLEE